MILVTGAAGYIGSHTYKALIEQGYKVLGLDNLSAKTYSSRYKPCNLVIADTRDKSTLESIFKSHTITAVIHFAALTLVGDSVTKPSEYYDNNIIGLINLLDTMKNNNVTKLIFSSSCSVCGNVDGPISADTAYDPQSPYATTKQIGEQIIKDYAKAYDIDYAILRYFNAAGAAIDGTIGDCRKHKTHLVPSILKASMNNQVFRIFGTDHSTPDGTCVRDYIHVTDLANAHITAFENLYDKVTGTFNVGTGNGTSVKQMISSAKTVLPNDFEVIKEFAREGDPASAYADTTCTVPGWTPAHSDLHTILTTAYKWERTIRN